MKTTEHEIHKNDEIHESNDTGETDEMVEIFEIGEGKVAYEVHEPVEKILYKEESYAIQGAVYAVYREMGAGFLEAVYQECLERELTHRGIPHRSQVELSLTYQGERLHQTYRADFICCEQIILELKAVKETTDEHRAQVFNYLKATGYRLGLLINFGHYPKATIDRIIL